MDNVRLWSQWFLQDNDPNSEVTILVWSLGNQVKLTIQSDEGRQHYRPYAMGDNVLTFDLTLTLEAVDALMESMGLVPYSTVGENELVDVTSYTQHLVFYQAPRLTGAELVDVVEFYQDSRTNPDVYRV